MGHEIYSWQELVLSLITLSRWYPGTCTEQDFLFLYFAGIEGEGLLASLNDPLGIHTPYCTENEM